MGTRTFYQHDPRHVDVLVESLVLGNGNTVQTPIVDDVQDDNPVLLDRSHVARCLFFIQDRADMTFAVNGECQITTQLHQVEASRSVLEGRGDGFLRFRLCWRQRNEEIIKRGSRARRTTLVESVHKKTEDHRQNQ